MGSLHRILTNASNTLDTVIGRIAIFVNVEYHLHDAIQVIDDARPTIILQTSCVYLPTICFCFLKSLTTILLLFCFISSVAPILAQRLVLNLRSINTGSGADNEKGTATQRSELVLEFAHGSIIGNIGAPLRTRIGSEGDEDGEDFRARD